MDLFVAGEIVKTRGLRGCVKVLLQMETEVAIAGLDTVCLEDVSGLRKYYKIRKRDISGKFLFLELESIASIDAARELVGCKMLLPVDLLKDLPDGEYYWRDIIGLTVLSEGGEYLGRIESIFPTGSNDVYVCKGGKEILLPAIADVIRHIDLNEKIMTVRLPEGL